MFTQDTVVAWSNVMRHLTPSWSHTTPSSSHTTPSSSHTTPSSSHTISPRMRLPPGICVQGKGVACSNVQ